MKSSSIALAAWLALGPLVASASTLQAYEIDKEQSTFVHPGSFVEKYLFQLDSTDFPNSLADVSFALTELKLGSKIDIQFGPSEANSVIFSRDLNATDVLWSGTPTPASYGMADVLNVDTFRVDVPVFYLTIAGNAIGTSTVNSGSYSFEITAMPAVPEPASLSLALAGLGAISLILRRRRGA